MSIPLSGEETRRIVLLDAEIAFLRKQLAFHRLILDGATDYAIMAMDAETSLNEGARRLFGYEESDILGRSADLFFTPEDRARGCSEDELRRAGEQGQAANERWHVRADGTRFWASGAVMALRARGEAAAGFVMILRDRTQFHVEAERRELLMAEMNHRLKNAFATVQAVALQTGREAPSLAEFQTSFVARLQALASSHDVLIRGDWRDAPLADVIARALNPYGAERIALHGGPVLLGASLVVTVSLALHELATNAVKYGALSNASGRVEVSWGMLATDGVDDRIEIRWRELGGPPVAAPSRRGFGSRLLEQGMPAGGAVKLQYHPAGVECHLCLPLRPAG